MPQRSAEISAPAGFSARSELAREQLIGSGVYINVFEQSILIDNRPNKSWSLLASLSAELVAVSVMILIPLLYGDHLPDFHWHVVTVGPPVRQIETPPTPTSATAASGPVRPVFHHPPLISNPIQATAAHSGAPANGNDRTTPWTPELAADGLRQGLRLFRKADEH